jgi:uncharacterized membrane protein
VPAGEAESIPGVTRPDIERWETVMIRSFLIGVVAGVRAMTPPPAAAGPTVRRRPSGGAATARLAGSTASAGVTLAGETPPVAADRIGVPAIAARLVTGAMAGVALAPREQRVAAALLGMAGAVGGAYLTYDARNWALRRYGRVSTGLVEDALIMAATRWIVRGAPTAPRR